MKPFKLYYSDDRIISYLCKIRISYAQKRNKKHSLNNLTSKKHQRHLEDNYDQYDKTILDTLDRILPKRRLWLTLDRKAIWEDEKMSNSLPKNRKKLNNIKKKGKKLNTIEKNRKCLLYTIKKYRSQEPQMAFVIELNKFIKDIQITIEGKDYQITKPDVLPEKKETNLRKVTSELKKGKRLDCRPISRFELKDRIILSITNKFLTKLFDKYFEDSSLAFRSVNFIDGAPIVKNHHTAIQRIIEYKKKYPDTNLNIAECDMKKFYDSVNHRICIKALDGLVQKAQNEHLNIDLSTPLYIFKEYLNCYSFKESVSSLNVNEGYWAGKGVLGYFPWIEKEMSNSEYYKVNGADRIGVPQGGALSGLIANIVLDDVDKQLSVVKDLFYIRYCDDMILMHPDEDTCKLAIETYVNAINGRQLFNHEFKLDFAEANKIPKADKNEFPTLNGTILKKAYERSIRTFWKHKSKGPYKWGALDIDNNVLPWIGFVGYEIKYTCETRVRIRSITKEIEKQNRVIQNILATIKSKKVVVNNTIIKSAFEKLNGMSVGRVELYNYKYCIPEMCWVVGFKNLNFNLYSKKQLKFLDRNKHQQIHRLKKNIGADIPKPTKRDTDNREILVYHKPFSYYYHAGEKKQILVELNAVENGN